MKKSRKLGQVDEALEKGKDIVSLIINPAENDEVIKLNTVRNGSKSYAF